MEGEQYVSMFKINGTPILPPLMTAARRREMLAYKQLAVALETRLKLEAKERENIRAQDLESISTIEDEYLKVSSMLQDHFSPAKLPPQIVSKKASPMDVLKKSDTFIYDINTNTVLIPREKDSLSNASSIESKCRNALNTKFNNICRIEAASPTVKCLTSPTSAIKTQKCSKHVAPPISVKPPTPERRSAQETPKSPVTPQRKTFETKGKTQRASTSPALKDVPPPTSPLVRSNSFTLDTPSPVLLQHMVRNRSKNSEISDNVRNGATKEITKEIVKRTKPKSPEKHPARISSPKTEIAPAQPKVQNANISNVQSEHSKLGTLLITNSLMFKNKKSPYETKFTGKSKGSKKHKTPTKKISSVILKPKLSSSHHHRSRLLIGTPSPHKAVAKVHIKTPTPPASPVTNGNIEVVEDKIREIEEQHRLKLVGLMKRQQEEQLYMQEQFEKQQKQLLEEFHAGLMSLKALSTPDLEENQVEPDKVNGDNQLSENSQSDDPKKDDEFSLGGSQCYDMTNTLAPPVSNSKQTPRCSRRLFGGCMSAPPPTPRQRGVFVAMRTPTTATDTARIQSPTKQKREQAATIINAYARGYLVRRIFRTDHVQNIVKTIQDTLVFVLKYHRETEYDTSEENILFKARLLQQLTSACQSLKDVFSMSTKEKMLLISRDRIYIQTKAKIQNRSKVK